MPAARPATARAAATSQPPLAPALYDTTVRHVRRSPLRHALTSRGYWWLVDLDHLPELPRPLRPLARFDAADHLDGDADSLRGAVDAFLADRGVDLDGGRVLLATNARVLGHVFNPLSVYWCHHADGRLACVLAEVHNTYGGRHTYLLRPDADGRATADKAFYVSPFNPIEGYYTLRLPPPGERLDLAITLHRPDQEPFVATVRGRRRPATTWGVLRAAVRHPLVTRRTVLQIRLHGIWLWLRRLPVVPRPRPDDRPYGPSTDTPRDLPT